SSNSSAKKVWRERMSCFRRSSERRIRRGDFEGGMVGSGSSGGDRLEQRTRPRDLLTGLPGMEHRGGRVALDEQLRVGDRSLSGSQLRVRRGHRLLEVADADQRAVQL